MDKVLEPLKGISPLLQQIKLDKKKAEAFPDLLKVFECHTQSTDCMIQFFKEPLVDNCKCKGCTEGIIGYPACAHATSSIPESHAVPHANAHSKTG